MKKLLLITTAIILLIANNCLSYKKETAWVPMSDGAQLYTVIWYPNDMQADEKLPVVIVRTIYGAGTANANASTLPKNIIVDNLRYIFVEQDIRGTAQSPGKFWFYTDDGWLKNKDGLETIDWISKQNWSNGKVCMYGLSNSAHAQYFAALTNPSNLVCGFAVSSCWDSYLDLIYVGGIFVPGYYDWLAYTMKNPELGQMLLDSSSINTEFFEYRNFSRRREQFNIPVFHVDGWYDYIQGPSTMKAFYDINYYGGENARGKQKLMIGPWVHYPIGNNKVGAITFPQTATVNIPQLSYDWFEYWVNDKKENRIANYPNISLYLMGPIDTAGYWNNWLYFQDWPFADTDTLKFYLVNDGTMLKQKPNENEKTLIYDPKNPFSTSIIGDGPQDWSPLWEDNKIITFESPVCENAYDVFGNVQLEVYMSSDREDTDVMALMFDIYPDGKKIHFGQGLLKARYRSGFDKEDFLIPGQIVKLSLDLHYTAYTIVPGHKLGIFLTSSNTPGLAINPNTSDPVNKAKDTLIANNTFHFGGDNATVLVLPIRKPGAVSVTESTKKQSVSVYPNPTSESTSINYELQTADRVKIDIFNSPGEKITTLVDEFQEAGSHAATFEAGNLPQGMYFYTIHCEKRIESGKLLLIK